MFSFFTVLPVGAGRPESATGLGRLGRALFWLPLVAVVLGGIEGGAAWGLDHIFHFEGSAAVAIGQTGLTAPGNLFGVALSAALVLALAELLTGFHHADGLADVADAAMAGGDRARRLAVLKDKASGAGAVAALALTYLTCWAALSTCLTSFRPALLPWLMMSVEVAARTPLLLIAAAGPSSHRGSGSVFVAAAKGLGGPVTIAISFGVLALLAVPLGFRAQIAAGGAALFIFVLMAIAGRRWFGGANGDLFGASVELGRLAALTAIAAASSI
jgi:adenosylcobinamide-GDP ribazoletransferase